MNWSSLTWFGDSNLLLPAAAVMTVALLLASATRQLTLRWTVAFGLTGLAVLATKIAFVGWGIGNAQLDFTGFSGHSALSACFWPAWAWLLTAGLQSAWIRRGSIVAGYLLAVGIGVSRLMLEVHSTSEVVSGLMVGAAGSSWFLAGVRLSMSTRRPTLLASLLALSFTAATTFAFHGTPAPTTHWIETATLKALGIATPFTRNDLRLRLQRS